ncbi:MFS transporter [Variovorax ginsengisoli]|uniref:MFS transporter n=1 Tax=Variovorax ginsengisoli TaxID=363844 RepID=A0ABT8SJ27_9BURK|nr:MFS transporter [Variovorax ginsengisoli]MDN8618827.1 MFS transporter [Variovorax ginsengisoli]MDO1537997.1 MFS transporter [Variovorax ginsengisoli]
MDRSIDGLKGRTSLVLGHCAGMIDIVALPVWVGIVLIGQFGLDPQRAGSLVTLFLAAVVVSSLFISPRVNRIRGAVAVPAAFGVAAAAFFALSTTKDYGTMALLHFIGGLAVGCGLSITHSTIGASANPHRLIAIAFTALSVLSFGFLGGVPQLVSIKGGSVLFVVLGSIMLVAAFAAAIGFPERASTPSLANKPAVHAPLARGVWFAMVGTSLMTLSHSMMLSYMERIGDAHGFSKQMVMSVLLAVGIVNLFPGVLAAVFERKLSAQAVMVAGPVLQVVLGLTLTQSSQFGPYAFAAAVFPAVMIFTHTFVFAFLARNDASTRAVAATPVITMTGSALGPIVGGVVAQNLGYSSIGWAVAVVATIGALCFLQAGRGTVRKVATADAATT